MSSDGKSLFEECDNLSYSCEGGKLVYAIHFKNNPQQYDKFLVCLDSIEDAQTAIDEYVKLPLDVFNARTTLNFYGLLQAIYLQQDALFGLYKCIQRKADLTQKKFFEIFEINLDEHREARNDIAGHPTNRNGGKAFYFLDRFNTSKYSINYYEYSEDQTSQFTIDVQKMIDNQKHFAFRVIKEVNLEIKKNVEQYKSKFNDMQLKSLLDGYDRALIQIEYGNSDYHRHSQAEGALETIQQILQKIEDSIKARYFGELEYNSREILVNLDLILHRLKNLYKEGRLLNNVDGKLFLILFRKLFVDLEVVLENIDNEFQLDDEN